MEKWKEFAIAAAAAGCVLMYGCSQRVRAYFEIEYNGVKAEEPYREYMHGVWASKDAAEILDSAWDKMLSKGALFDIRAWGAICDIAGEDKLISAGEAKEIADVVLNPETSVGKLWLPYKGPIIPLVPSKAEQLKLEAEHVRYKKWDSVMTPLVDDDGDGVHSMPELLKSAYKVLHQ